MNYICEKATGADRTCDFRSGKIILQRPIEREQMQKLLDDRQDRSAAPIHFEERPPVLSVPHARRRRQGQLSNSRRAKPRPPKPRRRLRPKRPPKRRRPRRASRTAGQRRASDVEITHAQRVGLDERAARLDLVAHQRREYLVGRKSRLRSAPCSKRRTSGPSWFPTTGTGFISPRPL